MAIDSDFQIPNHIAIIMDGNGRWAEKRFLTKKAGHKAGAQALKKITQEADKIGIKYLSVYAFSTENWKRSDEEIDNLMGLLRDYIKQYIDDAKKNNTRIKVIGQRTRIAKDLAEKIEYLEEITKDKDGLTIIIALDYGSRDEIIRAVQGICNDVQNNNFTASSLTEEIFESYLDTRDIPEPQLVIRTSGELRISNFLLWQSAYAEFYFTDKLWPDFNKKDLLDAIEQYNNRCRRFGGR